MHTILTFGASSARASINAQLARYAAAQMNDVHVHEIRLADFEMPLFSVDREKETGVPAPAHRFKEHIREADGILISFAEHNGSYSAVFKNLLDWASVIEKSMWLGRPMCLMATSPGARGGQSVLEAASARFKHMDARVVAAFSLPSFGDNFKPGEGIVSPDHAEALRRALTVFKGSLGA